MKNGATEGGPSVALFVTCLVDLVRPSVGEASVRLLEAAGCVVAVPCQTCCGQPAYNAGDRPDAQAIAKQTIVGFEGFDYVVVPSGSCTGMIKLHYAELFEPGDPWRSRAEALAAKTYELVTFLSEVMEKRGISAEFAGTVTYHDSCSGLRELGIAAQPRRLLDDVDGLRRVEMKNAQTCCGFGGLFCVKYGEVSNEMVRLKAQAIADSGAEVVLAGDLGCLLNIAGKLKRLGSPVQARHIAEVLANMTDVPAIGERRP